MKINVRKDISSNLLIDYEYIIPRIREELAGQLVYKITDNLKISKKIPDPVMCVDSYNTYVHIFYSDAELECFIKSKAQELIKKGKLNL